MPSGATMYDFRDLDLMAKLAEHGGMTSAEMADAVGLNGRGSMGSRLAWMRSYGFVEFDAEGRTWDLSPGGRRIITANIRASALSAIEKVPDEAMVEVMAHVTSRYRHGDALNAHLLRREFLFGTKR